MNANSIVPFMYESSSVPEIFKKHEVYLRTQKNELDTLRANKTEELYNNILDKSFLKALLKLFNKIYSVIEKYDPTLKFYIEGRRKSLISSEMKILKYLSENKSLDEFRDFYAFRIINFGPNTIETIIKSYKLANMIIPFMISEGFTPCTATEAFDNKNFVNNLGIIIPEESFIEANYMHLVKDYILKPKDKGYQSLHMAFSDSHGRRFEVQIRTFFMHMIAEAPSTEQTANTTANHFEYKNRRYSDVKIEFERNKINIDGYKIMNEKVFDFVGLEDSLRILQRQKTF